MPLSLDRVLPVRYEVPRKPKRNAWSTAESNGTRKHGLEKTERGGYNMMLHGFVWRSRRAFCLNVKIDPIVVTLPWAEAVV